MTNEEITAELFRFQDTAYRDFQAKLIPMVKPETIIGVRTPELRRFAKTLAAEKSVGSFLQTLPHQYFDENQLHAFILSEEKDFSVCIQLLGNFLPYIDNWATCDQLSPRTFKKHHAELLPHIRSWIASNKTYTVRFAIGLLMQHFLDEDFCAEFLEMVAAVKSEEYYIKMMVAWYFATALAKRYDSAVRYIEEKRLEPWTHNKTIQKAVESYRITAEQKTYLKSLRQKQA
ncbi:MAG: DNA alkylation repair protein [Treponema sp.]|nr:DNA alkylation repair protein [Treponema sp.]